MSQPVASEGSSSNVPSCLVNILRVGDNNAKCTMTLIRADNNDQDSAEHHPVILVDCGDPWDTDILIDSLAKLSKCLFQSKLVFIKFSLLISNPCRLHCGQRGVRGMFARTR